MTERPKGKPPGAGRSSFELIEPGRLWAELPLTRGMTILDLGCGQGSYTFPLATAVGAKGLVYALDLWEEGIARLQEQAAARGCRNIRPLLADASRAVPVATGSVDLCFLATVLHDLVEAGTHRGTLAEAARVLKPGGLLAIVEFKKIEGPPGPPLHIRLAPEEVEKIVAPYGFRRDRLAEVGPYNYLLTFSKTTASGKNS